MLPQLGFVTHFGGSNLFVSNAESITYAKPPSFKSIVPFTATSTSAKNIEKVCTTKEKKKVKSETRGGFTEFITIGPHNRT
jgi:hypothetical protein